jgi:hypothetical protein
MRCYLGMLIVALFAGIPIFAQTGHQPKQTRPRSLLLHKKRRCGHWIFGGDIRSLTLARADFTPEGWKVFEGQQIGSTEPFKSLPELWGTR